MKKSPRAIHKKTSIQHINKQKNYSKQFFLKLQYIKNKIYQILENQKFHTNLNNTQDKIIKKKENRLIEIEKKTSFFCFGNIRLVVFINIPLS